MLFLRLQRYCFFLIYAKKKSFNTGSKKGGCAKRGGLKKNNEAEWLKIKKLLNGHFIRPIKFYKKQNKNF
jgi:hypothetical protein